MTQTSSPTPSDADLPLDRALGHEGLYACPSALLAGIVAEHLTPAWSRTRRLAALAACALLAVGALALWTGDLPSTETRLAPPLGAAQALLAPQVPRPPDLLALAPPVEGGLTPLAAALGLLLVVGGLWLARRWGQRTWSPGVGSHLAENA